MKYYDFEVKKTVFGDTNYPKELTRIRKPPRQIYYRGSLEKSLKKSVAIVGSRMMTNYGKQVIDMFVSHFVLNGITTISGFMYGVDTEVHKKTLEYGGKTIAVLGNGLDVCYPPENDKLYVDIVRNGGAVMSEYEKDFKSQLWSFPARNRIVAGLATIGVLVIEADIDSGSLITAKLARKQGKIVWAIPGSITSKVSRGTNFLVKSELAKMATVPEDIYGKSSKIEQLSELKLNPLEATVYDILARESATIDEIAMSVNKDVVEVTSTVTIMGLKGLVSEAGGKFYLSKI